MLEKAARDHLLTLAQAYMRATKLSMSTVSRQFHGNCDFLRDFKAGECSITLRKYDEMVLGMQRSWPEGRKAPAFLTAPTARQKSLLKDRKDSSGRFSNRLEAFLHGRPLYPQS